MTVVSFAAEALPTADRWFQEPIQSIPVRALGAFSTTADGACQVALPDGAVAFVKPRPDTPRNLVVAREKIASDLAYMLELPVAPVVVRRPMPEQNWPHYSAMSLSCLRAGRLWAAGGEVHRAAAGPALEALRVFWTWIGDDDHNGHGENLLFEVRTDAVAIVAIDHSFSLCHRNAVNPLAVGECKGYGTKQDFRPTSQLTMVKIRSLEWAKIEPIVKRMHPILTGEEQERILNILKERRDKLRDFLGLEE